MFNDSDEDDVGMEDVLGGVVEDVMNVAIVPKGDPKAGTDEDRDIEDSPSLPN